MSPGSARSMETSVQPQRRVVVTGMGAVTPLGNDVATFWRRLLSGEGGVGRITRFDATNLRTQIAAEVRDLYVPEQIAHARRKHMARFALLALIAALEAWQQTGLNIDTLDPYEAGVVVGSSHGGEEHLLEGVEHILRDEIRAVSPRMISLMLSNMATMQIARHFSCHGPAYSPSSACATGAHAIGEAMEIIRRGDASVMLCGGTEACLTPLTLIGDQAARALSTRNEEPQRASRPFDSARDGFVLGEGAGILVLEEYEHARARAATIHAEIVGYGTTSDALHETHPQMEGTHLAHAIRLALRKANLLPTQLDAIFAHATGTSAGDCAEASALLNVLGDASSDIPVVALKAALGHTLSAAGAIQAIAAIKSLETRTLPPTLNLDQLDPHCAGLYIPTETLARPMEHVLSNAAGFGGHNVALIFRRWG